MKKLKTLAALSILSSTTLVVSCCSSVNALQLHHQNDKVDIFISGPRFLKVGETQQYVAKVTPESYSQDIEWSLSDYAAGTITADGKFTAAAVGENWSIVAILKSDPKIRSSFNVVIEPPSPQSISIDGPKRILIGSKNTYTAKVMPETSEQKVSWEVNDRALASIDTLGSLTARAAGTVIVTATSTVDPNISGSITVDITEAKPTEIKINGISELNANQSVQYDVELTPKEAYKKIRWSIDDTSIAEIDENGLLQAKDKSGTATIKAEALFTEGEVEVVAAETTLTISVGLYHDIIINNTIGTAYTVQTNRMVHGQTHHLRFVSTIYNDTSYDIPTHKNLKMSDIEILWYNPDPEKQKTELINDYCTLVNNELTIPAKYCDKDININILGGEISDAITWATLKTISNNDAFDEEESAKKYFQVGDYKNVYDGKGNLMSKAVVIDMNHDEYLATDSSGTKQVVKASFSFEFQTAIIYTNWTNEVVRPFGIEPQYYSPACVAHTELCKKLLDHSNSLVVINPDDPDDVKFNIRSTRVAMPENGKMAFKPEYEQYFWPMSLFEVAGAEPPSDMRDENYAGPEGTRYIYYEDREDGYQSIKTAKERLTMKNIDRSRTHDNEGWYYLRTTAGITYELSDPDTFNYYVDIDNGNTTNSTADESSWAFCPLFSI